MKFASIEKRTSLLYCSVNYRRKSFIVQALGWRYDTQNNDIQHNGLICDTQRQQYSEK
jgi:hypothetical protein